MTPLVRIETFVGVRLRALERQLPHDGGDSALWAEYAQLAQVLVSVRMLLYGGPREPATAPARGLAQAPARRRAP